MKSRVIYKSLVVIGSFNPSILTPDFLKRHCSFKSTHKPKYNITPVISELIFGNTRFLAELDKLQVAIKDIDNFDDRYPIDIVMAYLDVLGYTPLRLFGVNFNYTLEDIDAKAVLQIGRDPFQVGQKLKISPVSISIDARRSNGYDLFINDITLNHYMTDDIKNNIKITLEENLLRINNNYEVNGLNDDRSRINILAENYSDIVKHNQSFQRLLEDLSDGR